MLSYKALDLMPHSAPKGLTQNQYEWFLKSYDKNETSIVEMMISYDLINNADPSHPNQGNILREWIIREEAKNNPPILNQYVPSGTKEKKEKQTRPECTPKRKVKK